METWTKSAVPSGFNFDPYPSEEPSEGACDPFAQVPFDQTAFIQRAAEKAWRRMQRGLVLIWLLSKPMGSHFGLGAPPVYFSGDWDVHWTGF